MLMSHIPFKMYLGTLKSLIESVWNTILRLHSCIQNSTYYYFEKEEMVKLRRMPEY